MDQLLDPQEVEKVRKEQLAKLWERAAFTPVHKSEIPFGFQIFSHKWVDKCSKGVHKSRFTCADVKKARYSAEEEEGLDVFVPTPTPESHNLLEAYAPQRSRCNGRQASLRSCTCRVARSLLGVESSGASLVQRALQGNPLSSDGKKSLWKKDSAMSLKKFYARG